MTIITKWIKTGNAHDFVFLGNEVIATASGNHVIFYNLITKEEKIEYFNSPTRGEGVCCLAGHSVIPIFSTVERCYHPKIYIHAYPRIEKIAECKLDNLPNSYISCCFLGAEYLISLTSHPDFHLILWFWKTGEKVASIDTPFIDNFQTIEASLKPSNLIYQFSPALGELLTYDIHTYFKKATIIKNSIKLTSQKIVCVCWANNGNLLLCDALQNAFIASSDGKKMQMIVCKDRNINLEDRIFILSIKDAFVTLDNDLQLNCYHKSHEDNNLGETWNTVWFMKLTCQILKMTLTRHKEAILLYSESGKVFELSLTNEYKSELKEVFSNCPKIKFLRILNPQKTYGIIVDGFNCLMLVNLYNGNISANFQIDKDDEVVYLDTHPYMPFLSIITSSGKCICFVVSIEYFKVLKLIHLQRESLNTIKFSINGNLLGIASEKPCIMYLLKTVVKKDIKVILHINVENLIVDFLIFDHDKQMQILILFKTCSYASIGNYIEIYSVNRSDNLIHKNHKIYSNSFYKNLSYGLEKANDFLGVPYLSKHLHFLKIENNYKSIILVNIINVGHKLRKFDLNISQKSILTSGFDGFIILRETSNLSKPNMNFMVHHYQEYGTKYSISTINDKMIVCLGRNGNLVGLQICELEENIVAEKMEELQWECKENGKFSLCNDQTWLEQKKADAIQAEENKSTALKKDILTDIKILKSKISELLNLNENKDSEFQLPVSIFDFNSIKRKEKISVALQQREQINLTLQQEISQIESVINYLVKNFWNMFQVPHCILLSFNGNTIVNNFSLRHLNEFEKIDDHFIEVFDTPLSNIYAEHTDNEEIVSRLKLLTAVTAFGSRSYTFDDKCFLEHSDAIMLSGSSSFKWLNDNPPTSQLMNLNCNARNYDIVTSKEYKLKMIFNEKFYQIKKLKHQVLKETSERLKKLDELNGRFKNLFGIVERDANKFNNIKWHSMEVLEDIMNDDKGASSDMINNCLSNQNKGVIYDYAFREEKLEEMMDGLLEKRWEDEIAKDIQKPYCVTFKSPSKYDDEDIKAVEAYQQMVENLEIEREKYKVHLESEINNINAKIRDDIDDFDNRMHTLAIEKIKIQSAVLQEFLLRLNEEKYRASTEHEENKMSLLINKDLVQLEHNCQIIIAEIANVKPIILELKSKYENLCKRDKVLEAKLPSEFIDLKQSMLEHLLRHYKRRPNIDKFNYISLTCLTEMCLCLITDRNSQILPKEYLDFLCNMDAMDAMPTNLPFQIDSTLWQTFCTLRRNKVESEIKIKMAALELANAEQTHSYLQRLNLSIQNNICTIKSTIAEQKQKQLKMTDNFNIQIVLKSEQVEVDLLECFSNFSNATLVTYKHLTEINGNIVKEGKKNINVIRARMSLRKCILLQEWKYQCSLTKVKHLKEHLVLVQNTKVKKAMQNYLMERLGGKIVNKYSRTGDVLLNSMEKKFQRMLKEKESTFQKLMIEINYWRKMNGQLIKEIDELSSKKLEQNSTIDGNDLRKRNRIFKKNHLRSIMKRTSLVEYITASRNKLFYLQNQLELIKWKTYPMLYYTKKGL